MEWNERLQVMGQQATGNRLSFIAFMQSTDA